MKIRSLLWMLMLTLAGGSCNTLTAADFECLRLVRHSEVLNNKVYTTDSLICQVNNRNGERFATFQIHYSRMMKVSDISAWIEDVRGNRIRELKKSEFLDRSLVSGSLLYTDDRIKTFQMKHNVYPYRVCYTVTYTESQFCTLVDWAPLGNDDYPTREAILYVSFPRNYPVRTCVKNVSYVKTDTLPDKIVSEYRVKGDPAYIKKADEAVFDFDWPRVAVVPQYFKYGIDGSFDSWSTFGHWFENLNRGLTALPVSEMQKVTQLMAGQTDTIGMIRTLYRYLQDNTHYVNVNIGVGGMKSYPATYVAQNKYGDCKALTNYMKAMLEFAGIKSHFVLIEGAEYPGEFLEELPSPQFNHVILAVPTGKDTLWLENTNKFGPFGYVGSFIQNRKALWVDGNRSHLVSMPSLRKQNVTCVRTMQVRLDDRGTADFSAVFTNRGDRYESMNGLRNYLTEKDKNEYIDDYIPFTNYTLKSWKIDEPDRDSARVDFRLKLSIPKFAKMLEGNCYIPTLPIPIDVKIPVPARLPATFPWPICNVDSCVIIIPAGYRLKALPQVSNLSNAFASYNCAFFVQDDRICVSKRLEIKAGKYSSENYDRLYAFLKQIRESENGSFINLEKIQEQ